MVIKPDTQWKTIFDAMILIFVLESCIVNIYMVSFPFDESNLFTIVKWVIEGFFMLDIILNFMQGYIDPQEQIPVDDFKQIALKYVQGWFFIDFVSVLPF